MVESVVIASTPAGAVAPVVPVVAAERPAWLPAKFATPEDFAKSYGELETKLGGKPAAVVTEAAPGVTATVVPPAAAATATPVVEAPAGFDEFSQELALHGVLSEASMAKLAARGFSGAMVDNYIAGHKAVGEQFHTTVAEVVGGKDNYAEMIKWAAQGMTQPEIAAYNTSLKGGMDAAKLAAQGLYARFAQANGTEPNLMQGATGTTTSSAGYASRAEQTAAMRDPRYEKDPAYRAEVAQKSIRSTF